MSSFTFVMPAGSYEILSDAAVGGLVGQQPDISGRELLPSHRSAKYPCKGTVTMAHMNEDRSITITVEIDDA